MNAPADSWWAIGLKTRNYVMAHPGIGQGACMWDKNASLWFFIGCGLGYGVIHPLVMIFANMMGLTDGHRILVFSSVAQAFSSAMLPWSLGFGLLSGAVALLTAKLREARLQQIKTTAIMEMAGATCHELNQPMQVILGYSDLLAGAMDRSDDLRKKLEKITIQITRMERIMKQINRISTYQTRDYVHGIKIVDIEKASEPRACQTGKARNCFAR